MAEFKEVMRQYDRMCRAMESACVGCVLHLEKMDGCRGFMMYEPARAEELIMEWAKNHPEKTYLETLTERLPGLDTVLIPKRTCPGWFVPGWPKSQDGVCTAQTSTCRECWDRTAEKE